MKRFLLGGLAAVYIALAAWVYLSQPAQTSGTLSVIKAPLRWAPDHPLVWQHIGRYLQGNPEQSDPLQAEAAFLRAAKGNPMGPDVWTGLADAYLQMGEPRKAESALRTATLVSPHAPEIAWRLANSLVLAGSPRDALPFLRIVASSDPGQQHAAFDLAWKVLESGELVLKDVVPEDLDARASYLAYLIQSRKDHLNLEIWQELRRGQHSLTTPLAYRLIEVLLITGRIDDASAVWDDLLTFTGRSAARAPGTRVTNGDFEVDLLGNGLDWHLDQDPHWTFALDSFSACSRSRSLQVSFDGQSNPEFNHLWQWVIVEPNRDYRLRACIRTNNVVSDSGVQLMVTTYLAPPAETFTVLGKAHLGSQAWTEESIPFHTGPGTRIIKVGLSRAASHKLYGQLGGKVWVDNVRVEPVQTSTDARPSWPPSNSPGRREGLNELCP